VQRKPFAIAGATGLSPIGSQITLARRKVAICSAL